MSDLPRRKIVVLPDAHALAEAAANYLADITASSAVPSAICLTGGSTPKRLYELLATKPWRDRIPWAHVHWFVGDDKFVAPNDDLSNMGMARRTFLDACAPAPNIHPIDTSGTNLDKAASSYERELKNFHASCRPDRPLFDAVLMGVGPDGHTASLFPNDPALEEQKRWVVGIERANVAPFVPRVSLTLNCLARSKNMLFLASGHDKRDILQRVFAGEDLPAGRAHAGDGEALWMIDEAAAPANASQRDA